MNVNVSDTAVDNIPPLPLLRRLLPILIYQEPFPLLLLTFIIL